MDIKKKSILAKSQKINQNKETLVEHIDSLLFVLKKILSDSDFEYVDKKTIDEIVINFEKLLRISCVLHDLGKINIKMQETLEGKENIKGQRHNILTGAFLKFIFEKLDLEEEQQLILFKVLLLHHGSYNYYLDLNRAKIEESIYHDIEEAILEADTYNLDEIESYINEKLNIDIKFRRDILDYDFMDKFNEDFKGVREYQYIYILLKGFLNLIDHLASTQIKDFEYYLAYKKEDIDNKLIEHIREKNKLMNVEFKPVQQVVGEHSKENVLTQAFTGSGKTVADYRWYSNRKIFLVPNKISAESFYNDAIDILGVDNVGILHGDISLYVSPEEKYLSRNFAKPYIIATIDQLLLAMFKYPGYEKIFASIYGANITVDEVHLLDPRMYLILLYFIEFSTEYLNANFHLMTATLPKVYKERLDNLGVSFIESNMDEEVEENKKVRVNILKNDKKSIFKVVEESINKGYKVLIVKNTVKEAMNTFEFIKESLDKNKEVNLLHSRYKFEDKCQKYKDILTQSGDVWVSTQGVEISLDLDFPVVISDNAPMESIIQRMGRCNRHNTLDSGEFYIIDEDKDDVYDQGLKKITLKMFKQLKKSKNEVLSMKDRKVLLDCYYEEKEVKAYFEKEFTEASKIIKGIFDIREDNLNGKDIIFKYEPYLNIVDNKKEAGKLFRGNSESIRVILERDFELLRNKPDKSKLYREYQLNSIQVPNSIYYKLKKSEGIYLVDGYIVVREGFYSYSSEIGFKVNCK